MSSVSLDATNSAQGPTIYLGGRALSEKGWKEKFLLILKWRMGQGLSNDTSNFSNKSVNISSAVGFYIQCKTCNKYLLQENAFQHFYCCQTCHDSYKLCNICGRAFSKDHYQDKKICSTCLDYGRYRRCSSFRIVKYIPVKE